MKAIAIDAFGGNEKLQLKELPDPRPKMDEVLIRLKSAGVGHWDELYFKGEIPSENARFPLVVGWEGAGVVEEVGDEVNQFKPGDEVYYYDFPEGGNREGAWAERVCVPARCVAKKPAKLSLDVAGGLPVIALTAYQGLVNGLKVRAGQSILITNGAGGVGTCTIQIAKHFGLTVVALASKKNHAFLKELGADHVFDYHENFTDEVKRVFPDGVDCIYDDVGIRDTVAKAMPTLKAGGKFMTIVELHRDLVRKDVESKEFFVQPNQEHLSDISRLVDEGKLQMKVDHSFPLQEARKAVELVEGGHVHGKVVLKIA